MTTETGAILAGLRSASGLTQKQVAERMSANQTRVSRIEAGDGDEADVAAYLDALGSQEAAAMGHLLEMEWSNLPRPSLRHAFATSSRTARFQPS
jgi:transcriptional regulator with XRE-family HTH domain